MKTSQFGESTMAKTMAIYLLLVGVAFCGCSKQPTKQTVADTDDPAELLDIALHSNSGYVQEAAVEKLSDLDEQTRLKMIAVARQYGGTNALAASKLTDPQELLAITRKDPLSGARQGAILALSAYPDEAAELLMTTGGVNLAQRKLFRKVKITNQEYLGDIAWTHPDTSIRNMAMRKLTDQKALVEAIERNLGLSSAALDSIKRLTDQKALSDLAKSGWAAPTARIEAIKNLSRKELLHSLANDPDEALVIRQAATLRLKKMKTAQPE
jgi:hypothetical protein